jgi:flagellar protein FlgJ
MNISTKAPQTIGAVSQEKSPAQAMDQKLQDASKMYETYFLNQMMKAMRSTVQESGFIKANQGEKIFREKLDNEYVDKWSDRGGIGLADLIYQQLMDKFGAQMGLRAKESPPQGPLQLRPQDTVQMKRLGTTQNSVTLAVQPKIDHSTEEASKQSHGLGISNPWAGRLAQKIQLSADEYYLKIQHDEVNLTSGLHWRGTALPFEVGQNIPKGEPLGVLKPDQKSVVWSLQSQAGTVSQKNVSE